MFLVDKGPGMNAKKKGVETVAEILGVFFLPKVLVPNHPMIGEKQVILAT